MIKANPPLITLRPSSSSPCNPSTSNERTFHTPYSDPRACVILLFIFFKSSTSPLQRHYYVQPLTNWSASPGIVHPGQTGKTTKQIHQFNLGYPHTPPNNSPDLGLFCRSFHPPGSSQSPAKMGSFVFKWYVQSDQLSKRPIPNRAKALPIPTGNHGSCR